MGELQILKMLIGFDVIIKFKQLWFQNHRMWNKFFDNKINCNLILIIQGSVGHSESTP